MRLEGKGRDGMGPEGRGKEKREGRGKRVPEVTPSKKILDPPLNVALNSSFV